MQNLKDVDFYLENARILLIDDSEPFQNLTVAMLEKCGVASVDVASTLMDGMRKLHYLSNDDGLCPDYDAVLLDVNLPDGNGVCGCEFVSLHADTFAIPVVVISGSMTPIMVDEAFNSGAVDFLQKPFVASLLKKRLGSLLKLKSIEELCV